MLDVRVRNMQPGELPLLTAIMVAAFEGVSIDYGIEAAFGEIHGHDWRWRKARHLEDDFRRDPYGILVLERGRRAVGFVSTWIDREAGIGHIPNIALVPEVRGQGLGRQLLEAAFDRFRSAGVTHAKIETLEQNEIGNHLYRSVGFREVARQVHFVADLTGFDLGNGDAGRV